MMMMDGLALTMKNQGQLNKIGIFEPQSPSFTWIIFDPIKLQKLNNKYSILPNKRGWKIRTVVLYYNETGTESRVSAKLDPLSVYKSPLWNS